MTALPMLSSSNSLVPNDDRRLLIITVIVIVCSFLLRVFLASRLDLFPDEFLYAYLADHRIMNFSPHPPAAAFMVKIGTAIFGRNEIGARILSILLSTLTTVPVYLLARQLHSHQAGLRAALTAALVPIYFVTGIIVTPDATHVFFAALFLWLLVRAISTSQLSAWCLAGLALGIGLYVKYMLILFVPAILAGLILAPGLRRQLRHPGLYLMLIIAFFVFVPVAAHYESKSGWAAVKYHLHDRQSPMTPSPLGLVAYHGMHLLLYSPLLYPLLVSAAFLGVMAGRRKTHPLLFLMGICALLPFLFFSFTAAVTERRLSREQWDAIAYIPAIALTGVFLSGERDSARKYWNGFRAMWKPALVLSAIMLCLVSIEGSTGLLSRAIGVQPAFVGPLGWKQLSKELDAKFEAFPPNERAFLLGDSFQPVLAYSFYGKHRVPLYMLDSFKQHEYGIQHIVVTLGLFQDDLVAEKGNNGVFALQEDVRLTKNQSDRVLRRIGKIRRMFEKIDKPALVDVHMAGEVVKRFCVIQGSHLHTMPWDVVDPTRPAAAVQ